MQGKYLVWMFVFLVCLSSSYAINFEGITNYYSFDSNAGNISSNLVSPGSSNANFLNGANLSNGILVNASRLDGSNDYISINDTDNTFDFGGGDWCIYYWENRTVSTTGKGVLARDGAIWNPFVIGLANSGINNITVSLSTNGASWDCIADLSMGNIILNSWTMYAVTVNNGRFLTYQNGVLISNVSYACVLPDRSNNIFLGYVQSSAFFNGKIDELAVFKGRGCAGEDITQYYNNGTGRTFAKTPAIYYSDATTANNTKLHYTSNSIFVNASTLWFNATNNTINLINSTGSIVTILGTGNYMQYNFTNLAIGQYLVNVTATNATTTISSNNLNITIYNLTNGIFTNPTSGYNLSSNNLSITWSNATTSFNATNISYYNLSLLNSDSSFNRSLYGGSGNNFSWTDIYSLNLSIGQYRLKLNATDSQGYSVNNYSIPFNLRTDSLLNVSVFSSGTPVSSNISINGYSCVSSSCLFDVVRGNTYAITIDNSSYALNTTSITISNSPITYLNISLLPNNALNLTIRKESDGSILYQNASLSFVSDSGLVFSSNINGTKTLSGLVNDTYSVTISSSTYTSKTYRITIPDRTYNYYTMYLNNGSSILFNFKTASGGTISGVNFYVYTVVNGSNVLVESSISDITGKSQVALESNKYYYFLASASGYLNYTFSLNPVLYTSYDILMSASSGGSDIVPSAIVSFSPTSFYRYQNVNFNIEFISQYSSLTNYGYNVSFPAGSRVGSGNNSLGEKLNSSFNLNAVTLGDTITVYYWYNLSNNISFNNSVTYNIVYTYSNRTWVTMGNNINQSTGKDSVTGYFVGERVLIVTFISIVFFGIGWLAGGAIAGMVLAVIPILFFLNNGFVPKQLYYVTFFFIVVYLFSKGGDS